MAASIIGAMLSIELAHQRWKRADASVLAGTVECVGDE